MKTNITIEKIKAAFFLASDKLADAIKSFREATLQAIAALQAEGLDPSTIRATLRVWSDEYREAKGKSKDRTHINKLLLSALGNQRALRALPEDEQPIALAELSEAENDTFDALIALLGDGGDGDEKDGKDKKKPLGIVDAICRLVLKRDKNDTVKAATHVSAALAKLRKMGKDKK